MPRFIVRFMKQVLGENGRVSDVCQATIELEARDERDAERKAKDGFCSIHGTHDWSLHADRLTVAPTEFPS